jgi:hypothetical protein
MIAQGLSAHFAQDAEIVGGGMLAHLAVILAEGQVQHVVEALHRPVLLPRQWKAARDAA